MCNWQREEIQQSALIACKENQGKSVPWAIPLPCLLLTLRITLSSLLPCLLTYVNKRCKKKKKSYNEVNDDSFLQWIFIDYWLLATPVLDMDDDTDKNFYLHCVLLKVMCISTMEKIEKSCKVEGDCEGLLLILKSVME